MHFYIDESGIFSNPANKENTASCIGALIIPSSKKKDVFQDFERITRKWFHKDAEIKGKNLDEAQIAAVVKLLIKHDVLLEITVIDLGLHTDEDIEKAKCEQADEFLKAEKEEGIDSETLRQMQEFAHIFRNSSNQLYLQSLLVCRLISRTMYHGILYYSRRIPKELKWFYWTVDAKAENLTKMEYAWSKVIFPVLAVQSLKKPIIFIEGGDYSYFKKFQDNDLDYLAMMEEKGGYLPKTLEATKLEEILGKNFRFQDSKKSLGLQMVDVLVNATQRALNGKLDIAGWAEIGNLMIWFQNPDPLDFVRLNFKSSEEGIITINSPFHKVADAYGHKTKSLLRPDELRKNL